MRVYFDIQAPGTETGGEMLPLAGFPLGEQA